MIKKSQPRSASEGVPTPISVQCRYRLATSALPRLRYGLVWRDHTGADLGLYSVSPAPTKMDANLHVCRDMTSLTFTSQSENDTARLGAALAECVPAGSVVALEGPLGAGKTRLVQAWAAALGIDPRDVSSPTFVLCHEHHGRLNLYHFDAYRAKGAAEFWDLGIDEYFQAGGVVVIEWASRVAECLPEARWGITIEVTGLEERRFSIASRGPAADREIARLAAGLGL